ncbi:hypothetical protein [Tenacibaculum sp. UWU-22]|uniref:hypothetical protein n=1 Tax=Tenacibaculum sp. UWU-22 TaxID=3234187 RepID=UPI0034DACECF
MKDIKNEPPTLYKHNAGESVKSKFRVSIPPKLRFDVLKKKDKTQSVALANVRANPKNFDSEIPHYAYTSPLCVIKNKIQNGNIKEKP